MKRLAFGLAAVAALGATGSAASDASAQVRVDVNLTWGDPYRPVARDVYVRPAYWEARYRGNAVRVPPGHLPPPGMCRLWYPGRPPGHQPRPVRCAHLAGWVPVDAVVIGGVPGHRDRYRYRYADVRWVEGRYDHDEQYRGFDDDRYDRDRRYDRYDDARYRSHPGKGGRKGKGPKGKKGRGNE